VRSPGVKSRVSRERLPDFAVSAEPRCKLTLQLRACEMKRSRDLPAPVVDRNLFGLVDWNLILIRKSRKRIRAAARQLNMQSVLVRKQGIREALHFERLYSFHRSRNSLP
jgi:hypothetical protein